jgi:CubicO group peptidase (beta-lactamase class C family)
VLRLFLFLFCVFSFSGKLLPQAGNLKACLSKTKLFVELYNNKQHPQVYQQLDSAMQNVYSKTAFLLFLQDSLFLPYGKIIRYDHLHQTERYQSFLFEFEKSKREFRIALDANDHISLFQFAPYLEKQELKKPEAANDNQMQTGLDSLVQNMCKEYMSLPQTCGISIGILQDGKRTYYNYGEKSRGMVQLPDQFSCYEAGSITKTFTGLLLAQAIVEGKVKPDEDIREYLPGRYPNLAYGNTPITVLHLANHSSGLPRIPANLFAQENFDTLNPYKNYTEKMLYQDLRLIVIDQPPGSSSNYSNYGMAVLGKILERVYKKSYSELVQVNILNKLNMKNSFVALTVELQKTLLPGYSASGAETKHWNLSVFEPAGALHSSTTDMLNFLEYQLSEADSASKLSHKTSFDKKEKIALAWQIRSGKNTGDVYWHNGATYGFSSFCAFIPASKAALVILSNAAASTDYLAIQLLRFLSNNH